MSLFRTPGGRGSSSAGGESGDGSRGPDGGCVPTAGAAHLDDGGAHLDGEGAAWGSHLLLALVMGGYREDVPAVGYPTPRVGWRPLSETKADSSSQPLFIVRRPEGSGALQGSGRGRGGRGCWSGSQDAERCAIGKCTGGDGDGFPQKGAAGFFPSPPSSLWVAAGSPEPALIGCPLTPGLPPAGEGAPLSPVPFICRRQSPARGWGLLSRFVLRVMNV